jgi:predicted dehydrogenase
MNVVLIGLGMASRPHLDALAELNPVVRLHGVFVRNTTRREEVASHYGVKSYSSLDAVASDKDVDFVLIVTPPNARHQLVQIFASAGKAILMEKPVERTLSAATELVEICEAAAVPLGIVFQHRFRRGARRLAQLVRSGSLGELACARVQLPWWRPQTYYDAEGRGSLAHDGGGVLMTQAIHVLDYLLSIMPPVIAVQTLNSTTAMHSMETEDFSVSGLQFAGGEVASVVATTAGFPGRAETIEIDGVLGSAKLEAGELQVTWQDGREESLGEASGSGGGADPMAFPCDWHRDLIADFAQALRKGKDPLVSGRDALDVHRLIDAMQHSAQTGQVVTIETKL